MLCFVSSAFKGIECDPLLRKGRARKLAIEACKKVKAMGYEPISPVLAFSDVFDERSERERVMKNCFALLSKCEYFYIHQDDAGAWRNSRGMREELEYAKNAGKTVINEDLFTSYEVGI